MTLQHTINKSEWYRLGGLNALYDLLHQRTNNRDLVHNALLGIRNLLESNSESKYSISHARQQMLMSESTELFLSISKRYLKDNQIQHLSKSVLEMLFSNLS